MKKMGSLTFFENIDLKLNFTFDELMNHFEKTEQGIVDEFFEGDNLKISLIDDYVESYVNEKIREKFGNDYSLDSMEDTTNISFDVNVKSIKKKHVEKWWDKEKVDTF